MCQGHPGALRNHLITAAARGRSCAVAAASARRRHEPPPAAGLVPCGPLGRMPDGPGGIVSGGGGGGGGPRKGAERARGASVRPADPKPDAWCREATPAAPKPHTRCSFSWRDPCQTCLVPGTDEPEARSRLAWRWLGRGNELGNVFPPHHTRLRAAASPPHAAASTCPPGGTLHGAFGKLNGEEPPAASRGRPVPGADRRGGGSTRARRGLPRRACMAARRPHGGRMGPGAGEASLRRLSDTAARSICTSDERRAGLSPIKRPGAPWPCLVWHARNAHRLPAAASANRFLGLRGLRPGGPATAGGCHVGSGASAGVPRRRRAPPPPSSLHGAGSAAALPRRQQAVRGRARRPASPQRHPSGLRRRRRRRRALERKTRPCCPPRTPPAHGKRSEDAPTPPRRRLSSGATATPRGGVCARAWHRRALVGLELLAGAPWAHAARAPRNFAGCRQRASSPCHVKPLLVRASRRVQRWNARASPGSTAAAATHHPPQGRLLSQSVVGACTLVVCGRPSRPSSTSHA